MYKVAQKALDTIAEICMLSNDLHVIEINVDLTIFYRCINESNRVFMRDWYILHEYCDMRFMYV